MERLLEIEKTAFDRYGTGSGRDAGHALQWSGRQVENLPGGGHRVRTDCCLACVPFRTDDAFCLQISYYTPIIAVK
jgi:hypothetical protein